MKKRILSALTAMALALTLVSPSAMALGSEPGSDPMGVGGEIQVDYLDDEGLPSNDEMYAGYIWKMFSGEEDGGIQMFSTGTATAGSKLEGDAKTVYDAVAAKIPGIAKNGGSTEFKDLGVTEVTSEIARQVFYALCFDFPYEMYWRALGYTYGTSFAIEVSPNYAGSTTITAGGSKMCVEVDSTKATAASNKIEAAEGKAQTILKGAQEKKTNIEKLKYFLDEICGLVTYDKASLGGTYGNPWQVINVFDGDEKTNVVCEGYAKAFQYLCDKTFAPTETTPTPSVQCYTVTGTMGGGTGAGNHMWNIVRIGNTSYLVDVTNCDEGSAGNPDWLFMAAIESGNVTDGYSFYVPSTAIQEGSSLKSTSSEKVIEYSYDEDSRIWGDDVLTISSKGDSGYERQPYIRYSGMPEEETVVTGTSISLTAALANVADDTSYTYSVISSGGLPAGLSIDANTGAITGSLTAENSSKATAFIQAASTSPDSTILTFVTFPAVAAKQPHNLTDVPGNQTLTYGGTYQANAKSTTGTVSYESNASNVATIDENGNVKAVGVGTATITVKVAGSDNYAEATGTFTVTVTAKPLTDTMVVLSLDSFVYNGKPQTPTVTVTDGGTLTAGTDYEVVYQDASGQTADTTNVGTVTVVVTGKGNYSGTVKKSYSITKATPVLSEIAVSDTVYTTTNPADVTVSGTAKVGETPINGTWAFKEGTTFTTAQKEYVVVFTPDETNAKNCNSAEGKVAINVTERTVTKIEATKDPDKKVYNYGDKLDLTGMEITVTYSDSTKEKITTFPDDRITHNYNEGVGDVGTSKVVTLTWAANEALICTITITVNPKEVSLAGISWNTAGSPFTYDGNEKSATLSGAIPEGVTVEKTNDKATNAGNYTATATFTAVSNNYTISGTNPITANWTINQATAAKTASVYVKNDGTAKTVNLAELLPAGEPGTAAYSVTSTATNLATASVDDGVLSLASKTDTAPASGTTETVTVEVTGLTNYSKITITVTVTFTDKTLVTLTVNPAANLTYDGAAKDVTVAGGPEGAAYTYLYTGTTAKGDAYSAATAPKAAGSYSVSVSFENTENAYTGNAAFTIAPKAVTVKGITQTIKVNAQLPALCTVEGVVEGETLAPAPNVTCEAVADTVGTYPITVDGPAVSTDGNYSITYENGTLTIEASTPVTPPDPPEPPVVHVTGVSLDQSALHLTVGGTAQLIASVVPGNADNRNVTWSSSDPTVASVSGGAVTALRTGSAVITVTTADGGYAASCTVTVTAPVTPPVNPGGGGTPTAPVTPVVPNPGAPGGSSNNNNNSSNNNNNNTSTPGDSNTSAPSTPSDSPVVPEATVSGGTAAAQVTNDQAAQLVDQAASGNSTVVIAPEVSGSVTRTEVSIPASAVSGIASGSNASLKVETPAANITISNSGLAGLGGQDVVVAAEKVGGAVSVEITAGGQPVSTVTGGVKAEIPADCGPGTVAQVVDENGNVLSTVRKSFASAGGDTMNVPLDGSAKVVFVDNSKSFADVPANNWAANAVAFASGHELMNGVSATSFSPAEPMTRGMLAVVLHNLEGNPSASYSGSFGDVSGNAWYAEAVQWAADNSIIGGVGDGSFAPDASITREQLVVMLYRYAGQPETGSALGGFSDAGSVSSWAQQAMAWAVSSGIVGGSNGALNPQSGATRAEVAQMLMNFVSSGAI